MSDADNGLDAVVRQTVTVDAPIETAFDVFVARFDDIKPHDHNLLAVRSRRRSSNHGSAVTSTIEVSTVPSHPDGRWRAILPMPARSRSGSSPRIRAAPGSSWSIAGSSDTAPTGLPSSAGSAARAAGRCTWIGTSACSDVH
jgi:hypothetical protein